MSKAIQFEDDGEKIYPIVVEKIENENGTAIKYADGTMKCFGNKTFSKLNFNTKYGSIYHANTQSITFAEKFIDNPTVNLTPIEFGGGIGGVSGRGVTSQKIEFYLWHAIEYILSVTVSYEAIGKWK